MNIRILGAHNSESRDTKYVSLLLNDSLAIDAGALTSLSIRAQLGLKAILLTHKHYDHIRDIPGIALNLYHRGASTDIYAPTVVKNALEKHLLNGHLYPRFQELPGTEPTVRFHPIVPYETHRIDGCEILALPVKHNGTTTSYQVSDASGKSVFYTADTGPGLADCWQYVSPQLLIVDVTFSNSHERFAISSGHLTPGLLHQELIAFRESKGYLPQIVVIHMDIAHEPAIRNEVALVAGALGTSIAVAREGMQLNL